MGWNYWPGRVCPCWQEITTGEEGLPIHAERRKQQVQCSRWAMEYYLGLVEDSPQMLWMVAPRIVFDANIPEPRHATHRACGCGDVVFMPLSRRYPRRRLRSLRYPPSNRFPGEKGDAKSLSTPAPNQLSLVSLLAHCATIFVGETFRLPAWATAVSSIGHEPRTDAQILRGKKHARNHELFQWRPHQALILRVLQAMDRSLSVDGTT